MQRLDVQFYGTKSPLREVTPWDKIPCFQSPTLHISTPGLNSLLLGPCVKKRLGAFFGVGHMGACKNHRLLSQVAHRQ